MTTVICGLPLLSRYDAASNDVRMQATALRRAGYETYIYAETFEPGCEHESIDGATFERLTSDPASILIYHMCVAWPLLDAFLARARCRVVLRYHNITPPRYFEAFDPLGAHATRGGLEQMARLYRHKRVKMLMPQSPFTLADAVATWGEVDIPKAVVAPFMNLPDPAEHVDDPLVKDGLHDGRLHLFFIGRWAPNKGHQHMVSVVSSYHELYGKDICLTIAGGVSPNFLPYQAQVKALVDELQLGHSVRLVAGVSDRQLVTYLRHATAFLLMSEHEGFCVPVVEAQSCGLPVLALDRTAVGHTVGPEQMLFGEPDYDLVAAAAGRVHRDKGLRERLVAQGRTNAARFSIESTSQHLLTAIKSLG